MSPDLIEISNDHLRVCVSALGAETQSLQDAHGQEYLWQGDPAYWRGRAPVLFPIVGAAPGGQIAINGVTSPMPQHGFARRSLFRLEEHGDDFCCHTLTASEATRAVYPFEFTLRLRHALEGATLRVSAEITNHSADTMPFGFGFHPAFAWPLPGAQAQPHHIHLDNQATPALARIDHEGLLQDARLASPFQAGTLTLDPRQFDQDAMIFPEGAGQALSYEGEGGARLRFAFENLPNLALWTKPGAPYLCIEPWHGMAARAGAGPEMAQRPSTCMLTAGHSARFAFSVAFDV